MSPRHVQPSIALKSFNCPVCGALADQAWFSVYADPSPDNKMPFLITPSWLDKVTDTAGFRESPGKGELLKIWKRELTGVPFLKEVKSTNYVRIQLSNIHISQCYSCDEVSIWRYDALLYPPTKYEIEPNSDMNEDIRADFEEARAILSHSPRGAAALLRLCIQKLCKQLGKLGENINADIAALVKDGLDSHIQQALDIVRVVGNEAVHPGELDLRDDRETAAKLFELVNLIAEDCITRPKRVQALFERLPREKLEAIKRRDRS
jgi:hypothetical protein